MQRRAQREHRTGSPPLRTRDKISGASSGILPPSAPVSDLQEQLPARATTAKYFRQLSASLKAGCEPAVLTGIHRPAPAACTHSINRSQWPCWAIWCFKPLGNIHLTPERSRRSNCAAD